MCFKMNGKRKKLVLLTLHVLLMSVFLPSWLAWGFYDKVEGVVAVVDDEVITVTDLRNLYSLLYLRTSSIKSSSTNLPEEI